MKWQFSLPVYLIFLLVINLLVAGCGTNVSTRPNKKAVNNDPVEEEEQPIRVAPLDEPRNPVIVDDVLYVLARNYLYAYELRKDGRAPPEEPEGTEDGEGVDQTVEKVVVAKFEENIIDRKVIRGGGMTLKKTSMVGSTAIASKGDYLYIGGRHISIVDISNKFTPRFIRSLLYTEQDKPSTMFAPNDDRCYGAPDRIDSSFDRLLECNVSQDGDYATEVYHYQAEQYLTVSGDYLIASGSNSMGAFLFDISDPARPKFISSFGKDDVGFGGTSVLHDEYIYHVGHDKKMYIYHRLESALELPRVAEIAMDIKVENALVTRGYLIVSGTKPADPGLAALKKGSAAYDEAKAKTAIVVYNLADPINPIDMNYIPLSGPSYGDAIGLFGDCIAVSTFGFRRAMSTNTTSIELISVDEITENLAFDAELSDLSLGTIHGGSTMNEGTPYTVIMNDQYLFAGGDTYVLAESNFFVSEEQYVEGEKVVSEVEYVLAEENPCGLQTSSSEL